MGNRRSPRHALPASRFALRVSLPPKAKIAAATVACLALPLTADSVFASGNNQPVDLRSQGEAITTVTGVADRLMNPISPTHRPAAAGAPLLAAATQEATASGGATPPAPETVAIASATAIPARALQAYLEAEAYAATELPGCGLQWQFLAAFGEVESHHGSYGGAVMSDDGVVSPGIYGPPTPYGRAVGPMQFLESTWAKFGAGANPQDIDEAAKATARYLCYGGRDLGSDADRRAAAFSYNHADWYVANIIAVYEDYLAQRPGTSRPASVPPTATDDTRAKGSETPELPDAPPAPAPAPAPAAPPATTPPPASSTPPPTTAPADPPTSAPPSPGPAEETDPPAQPSTTPEPAEESTGSAAAVSSGSEPSGA